MCAWINNFCFPLCNKRFDQEPNRGQWNIKGWSGLRLLCKVACLCTIPVQDHRSISIDNKADILLFLIRLQLLREERS